MYSKSEIIITRILLNLNKITVYLNDNRSLITYICNESQNQRKLKEYRAHLIIKKINPCKRLIRF